MHNRASILQTLEQTLGSRGPGGTAVIFLDLDRFKDINDRFGHAAGDAYLVEVAARLRSAIREHDVVGRIGGDEFLVVCRDVDTEAAALELGQRLHARLEDTPVALGAEVVNPRASIGVAWSNSEGMNADALVALADVAMYESKRQRQGRPVLFSDHLETAA